MEIKITGTVVNSKGGRMSSVVRSNLQTGVTTVEFVDAGSFIIRGLQKAFPEMSSAERHSIVKHTKIPETIIGRAKCNWEEDSFDLNTGASIALYRANQKMHRVMERVYFHVYSLKEQQSRKAMNICVEAFDSMDISDRYSGNPL